MSALGDYVGELKRRAELLDMASSYDDATLSPRVMDERGRRHHTRQDANRLEYQWATEDCAERTKYLPVLEQIAAEQAIPERRMRTRVGWFLAKFKRQPISAFRTHALRESQEQGTFNIIAPLIEEADRAHKRLLAAYKGDGSWSKVERLHDRVIERLAVYLPSESQSGSRQSDTKTDTLKKRRKMNVAAVDCCRIYREQKAIDPTYTMKQVVSEYVEAHSGSEISIYRTLNDNPEQWQ